MQTVVIYGTVDKANGNYADIDLIYNVDDGVTIDDIAYFMERQQKLRLIPIKIGAISSDGTESRKLSWVIAMDRERRSEATPQGVLNRVAVNRQIEKDVRKLDWHQKKRKK